MNKLLSLIQDDTGAISSMRVALLLIIIPIMTVWAVLSIKRGEFIALPWETMTVILGALGAKAYQANTENRPIAIAGKVMELKTATLGTGGPLPTLLLALCLGASLAFLSGCARFTTRQTQLDTIDANTGKILNRQTETRATATTFFEAKSALANFKASQTDKSQSATVGTLNQEASSTNLNTLIGAITEAAVAGGVKAAKATIIPVP